MAGGVMAANQARKRGSVKTSGCGWQDDAFDHLTIEEMDHVANNQARVVGELRQHGRLLEAQECEEYVAALIEQIGIREEEGGTHPGHMRSLIENLSVDPADYTEVHEHAT
jgi:hypothetical protein